MNFHTEKSVELWPLVSW